MIKTEEYIQPGSTALSLRMICQKISVSLSFVAYMGFGNNGIEVQ
jgi:hypothetical protein